MREFKVISGLLHMSLTYYRVIGDSESVVGEVKKEGESESERGETDETTESEESLSPRKDTKADMQDYVQRFLMQSENIEFWWKLSFWEDLFYGTYLPPSPNLAVLIFPFPFPFSVPFPFSRSFSSFFFRFNCRGMRKVVWEDGRMEKERNALALRNGGTEGIIVSTKELLLRPIGKLW